LINKPKNKNDQKLQQSWIAKMKKAMPQFSDEIDRLLEDFQRKEKNSS